MISAKNHADAMTFHINICVCGSKSAGRKKGMVINMSNQCNNGTSSRRRNYKKYIIEPRYAGKLERPIAEIRKKHMERNKSAEEYKKYVENIATDPVVQQMKEYNHHSETTCFEHSVHVSYYNYLICKKFGWDTQAAAKAGLLHDLFLYDWHGHKPEEGERMHGFEHPTKALKNAQSNFDITRKEGDIISKHMFPLTITPPKYKESYVIVMTDKFCGFCEVVDGYLKKDKRDKKRVEKMKQKHAKRIAERRKRNHRIKNRKE